MHTYVYIIIPPFMLLRFFLENGIRDTEARETLE